MDSVSSVVGIAAPLELPKGIVDGGRRARASEKAGEGKMVSDLTRMLVIVSGWMRCGLNWYLFFPSASMSSSCAVDVGVDVVFR